MEISPTVTIPCGRDELFGFLRDPDHDPQWCSTVRSSELPSGSPGDVGAVYRQVHKPGPFPAEDLQLTLTGIEPPEQIGLRSGDSMATFDVTYRLEDLGDGVTRVTQHDVIHLDGIRRLPAPVLATGAIEVPGDVMRPPSRPAP